MSIPFYNRKKSMKAVRLFLSLFLITTLADRLTPCYKALAHSNVVSSSNSNDNLSASCDSSSCHSDTGATVVVQRTTNDEDSYDENSCETVKAQWSEEHVADVIDAWGWNNDKQEKLMEMRIRLSDIDNWKNNPADVARFLEEHNFHTKKAEQMFRGMIQWRMENDIDTFMEHYEPPELMHYWPLIILNGLDKDKNPIMIQRLGVADAWGLYQRGGGQAMLEANYFLNELQNNREQGIRKGWRWQTEQYEPRTGRQMTQMTIIVDLQGLSPRVLRPAILSLLRKSARIAQDHYPGLAKHLFVIRAPRIFEMAWSIVKHFYDQQTLQKLHFTTHDNYLDVLSQYMDLDDLPSCINPNGKGKAMPGYYENIHLDGILPK